MPPPTRRSRSRRTAGSTNPSARVAATARLRGPIANSRNVPLRTRRRRAPSALLRTALSLALLATLALAISRLMDSPGPAAANRGHVAAAPVKAADSVAQQPAVPGLEQSACVSFAPTHGHLDRA